MASSSKWLLPLAAVLVVAAFFLRPQSDQAQATGGLLIPELAGELESIEKVEIVTANNNVAIELNRVDGAWGIAQRGGYPIQFDRLRSILRALAQLKTAEAMTSNPAYYDRLGLVDVAEANSEAKAIRLYKANGEKVAGLLLGNSIYRGGNELSYIRLEGDAQSWLVQGGLDLWMSAVQWLDKDLLNTPRAQIVRVNVTHPDGEVLTVQRELSADGEYAKDLSVLNVPDGEELLYPSIGNSPAEVLQNLRLEDVQTAASFTWQTDNIVTTELTRKDGLVVTARAERRETEYFLALAVTYNGDNADLAAEVEKLNKRFAGWVYELQPYKYQALAKRMRQMLKE